MVTDDGSNALLDTRQTVPLPGVHVADGFPGLLGGVGDVPYPPEPPQAVAAMMAVASTTDEMMFMHGTSPRTTGAYTPLAAKRSVQAVEADATRSVTAGTRRPPSGNFSLTEAWFHPGERSGNHPVRSGTLP